MDGVGRDLLKRYNQSFDFGTEESDELSKCFLRFLKAEKFYLCRDKDKHLMSVLLSIKK